MAVKMTQSLKQTQSLAMTPQLQQAIKLLTLTHMEMTELISQEMVENPMLEEMEPVNDGPTESEGQEAKAEDFSGQEIVEGGKEEFDWEAYIDSSSSSSSSPSMKEHVSSDEMPSYENMISREETLTEHLEWQLRMEELPERCHDFAMKIIHNLNDDGYLDGTLEELSLETDLGKDDVLMILKLVQNFDPIGCACRDLRECLIVQARGLEERMPLVEQILDKCFSKFEKRDFSGIATDLGVSVETVKQADLLIQELHPKPGKLITPSETHYVVPDIFVKQVGTEFVIALNDDGVPRLKISKLYKSLMENKNSSKEAQDYVQDKLRAALWLIKSIENRQKTIHKVAESIVRNQQDFFKRGPAYLKPMILKDVANEIGMHESTVSRVTTNKYLHTPIGTYEMKYFFSTGIGGKNGGIDIAGESLKLKIKKLIELENPKKPLSDQKIVDILSQESVVVARRTVTKYREMMEIPSSSDRKKS